QNGDDDDNQHPDNPATQATRAPTRRAVPIRFWARALRGQPHPTMMGQSWVAAPDHLPSPR
ncbi:MAG TPA: hypothetical protein VGR90_02795, partial [Acidimicrobiales bacterium]|nr:hypothetical protein [Acidimicrobiales bacterium]